MLNNIWELKVQLIPIILAFLIFEIPTLIQRLKKLCYVPIYFSVFPFTQLNYNLSTYLAEDYSGEDLSDPEAEVFRKKLILISILSVVIATIIIPSFTGFLGAFFLTETTLLHFLMILGVYKTVAVTRSILNFHYYSIATKRNRFFLGVIYFFYIGIVLYTINAVFYWTTPFVVNKNWGGLISGIADLLFGKIALNGIIISLLTAIFTSWVADRKIRMDNMKKQYAGTEEQQNHDEAPY